MLNNLGLLTAYQSIAFWVDFVRTKGPWLQGQRRTVATFLLSLHSILATPTIFFSHWTISAKTIFCLSD